MSTNEKKFKRAILHLGEDKEEYVTSCLQAVEDCFSKPWLEKSNTHRLQKLWSRKDFLATNELFCLGRAILNLKENHSAWLKKTAAETKKNIDSSHGLITEIIVCGLLKPTKGKLTPADSSQPGFDATMEFEGGEKNYISIKNHDISSYEKNFKIKSKKISEEFLRRLKRENFRDGRLIVYSKGELCTEKFQAIKNKLHNQGSLREHEKLQFSDKDEVELFINRKKYNDSTIDKKFTSHQTSIISLQSPKEQRRFKNNLLKAAKNISKNINRNESNFSTIFMRVHSSANLDQLYTLAQELLESKIDHGFDCVFFSQPIVTRSQSESLIIHHIRIVFNARMLKLLKVRGSLNYEIGVGSISMSSSPLVLTNGAKTTIKLEENQYIYQTGDKYIFKKIHGNKTINFNLESLADGVRQHAVVEDTRGSFLIKGNFPETDELLII